MFALAPWLMQAMGAEPDVRAAGRRTTCAAGCLGFPMLMALYAVSGSLRGMGNTWMPMVILIIVNLVNLVVTYSLISGSVARSRHPGIGHRLRDGRDHRRRAGARARGERGGAGAAERRAASLHVSRESFGRLFHIGLPVGLEEAQFMLAFLVYTRIVARLGTDQLAAHSLALRSLELAILPGFALGTAATALVGQYLGAGRPDLAEDVAKRVRAFALMALCTMAVLQFILAPYIVRLFVDDPAVVDTATKLLRVFSFALPGMAIHASLSGALRGAGDVRYVLGTFTFTAWCVRVPMAAFMVIVLGFGAPFAWAGAVTENWVRAGLIAAPLPAGASGSRCGSRSILRRANRHRLRHPLQPRGAAHRARAHGPRR